MVFQSLSYDDFTEVEQKSLYFSKSLENNKRMKETVEESISETLFSTESSSFLKNIASAVEFIVQHYKDPSKAMQHIVDDVTSYIIYNWRPAGIAINQIKDKFFADYLVTKDSYMTVYLGLLVAKCVLIALTAFLAIGLDCTRIWRKDDVLNCLLEIEGGDAKNALAQIVVFDYYLSGGTPFVKNAEGGADVSKSRETNRNRLSTSISSFALTNRTESFAPMDTNNRIKATTTAATESDSKTPKRRRLNSFKLPRPNVLFIGVMLIAAGLGVAVSVISHNGTQAVGYNLKDYISNAFALE